MVQMAGRRLRVPSNLILQKVSRRFQENAGNYLRVFLGGMAMFFAFRYSSGALACQQLAFVSRANLSLLVRAYGPFLPLVVSAIRLQSLAREGV